MQVQMKKKGIYNISLIMFIFNLIHIYSNEEEQRKHRQTTQTSAMKDV